MKGSEKVNERSTVAEKLIAEFTDNYLEKIFCFCLKKTENTNSAEDLMQDIALNIIVSLNKGTNPENFSAWVWKIARNRYSVWAQKKHKKAGSIAAADIGDYDFEDESADILDTMIRSEQLSLLRRELAFISSDYRNIILAYYIDYKSVRQIAQDLSLSENAVKQKLYRARKILKEGMNMAREFGIRSYKPEEIVYHNNCSREGNKNQPYSVMEHKLYKNIFLEAYGNPSTAEELSLELGVALPYMENELEYLTNETFLIKKDNKYQTSFPIISRNVQEKTRAAQSTAAPDITKALIDYTDRLNSAFKASGYAYYGSYQDYESAKWALLMLAYDHFHYTIPRTSDFTERPDGGHWDMIGFQQGNIIEPYLVGNHGGNYGFQQFKYYFDGIADRTPSYLTDEESKTLRNCVLGDSNEGKEETLKALEKYGYLRKVGDSYVPDFLVLKPNEIKQAYGKLDKSTVLELSAAAEKARKLLKDLYDKIAEAVRADLPAVFIDNGPLCRLAITNIYHARGYVMEQALNSGWLMEADKVSPVIGAHLFIE